MYSRSRKAILSAMVGLVVAFHGYRSAIAAESNWPQFRGPLALGVADNPNLPDTWSETENILWKRDIPGRGWSSPIVWKNRIFVTSVINLAEGKRDKLERARGLYLGGNREAPPASEHEWHVYCVDLESGEIVWDKVAHRGVPTVAAHVKNTFASETPVTDGERVYAYFGALGVFCYNFDGELLWKRAPGVHKTLLGWGTASSPALHQDRLFIVNDNEEQSYLVALDTRTGDEVWRTSRTEHSGWATPYIWQNGQRTEIVISGSEYVRSYDLDGKLLWTMGGMSGNAVCTPMAGAEFLYVGSGYTMGTRKPIMAVRPGASGDITLGEKDTKNDFVAWVQRKAAPYNPSFLLYRDYIYVVLDAGGIFACYDAKTGEVAYEKKRLPNGRAFTASPFAYNGNVFCLNEYGDTFVIKAGPAYELVRVNSLGPDEMCLASPAIVGDKLLIRSDHSLYAIGKKTAADKSAR